MAPAIELITIGNELLRGAVVDGNAAWLGRRLLRAGITVTRRTTVGDDDAAIRDAITAALGRTRAVLCTGGLGPTSDDRTRPVAAALYGRELRLDHTVLAAVRARFAARGVPMPAVNTTQAEVPAGAHVFANPAGTAPGLALDSAELGLTILLPGVPAEVRALGAAVTEFLAARWADRLAAVETAVVRTTGLSESALYERVHDLVPRVAPVDVAFLPDVTGVDVVLVARGAPPPGVEAAAALFAARLAGHVYARDARDLAAIVGALLHERGALLAVAESCTGGLLAQRITDVPGSSAWFDGGVVTYGDAAKTRWLGLAADTIATHGAVSDATARAMARGICAATGAACGVAITGIAGPGGGSAAKPVGTVWIAVALEAAITARHFLFSGTRTEIRARAVQAALRMLQQALAPAGAHDAGEVARRTGGTSPASYSSGSFLGVRRLRLHYRAWESATPRAALIVVHGHGEHGERYAHVAERLASAARVSTYALDLRGHGRSDGRRGHVARFDEFLQDVDRFRREVEGLVPAGTPLFMLGQSLGGLIVLRYVEEYDAPINGAVLCSPWLATALRVPRWKLLAAQVIGRVLPAAPFHTRLDAALLTRDAVLVQAHRDDPLVHDVMTPRAFAEIGAAMGLASQRGDRIGVPLLFMLAGDDRVVDAARAHAFARTLAARDVTIRLFAEAFHELLNDTVRGRAMDDIIDWITPRLGPTPDVDASGV